MVKTKRGLRAIPVVVMCVIALAVAVCFSGFYGGTVAFAADETQITNVSLEDINSVKGLWKVTASGETAPQTLLDNTDSVADGVFVAGDKTDYYAIYKEGVEYTLALDENTEITVGDGKVILGDIIDIALTEYFNETAEVAGETETRATVTVKDGYAINGESTATIAKNWAAVTPHNGYTANGEKYAPLAADAQYGDTLQFNTPAPAHGSGDVVYELTKDYLHIFKVVIGADGSLYEYSETAEENKGNVIDKTLDEYANSFVTNAGTYTVKLSSFDYTDGDIKYLNAEYEIDFTYNPYNMGDEDGKVTVTALNTGITYTGSQITPGAEVMFDGNKLTANVDYTTSYENNVNAGTATVVVRGTGNFTGEKRATFEIIQANNRFTSLNIAPWQYGSFDANSNIIVSAASFGIADAKYTVYKKTVESEETAVEGLTDFVLNNGAYSEAVIENLKKLSAGNYVLRAEIDETASYKYCEFTGGADFTVSVATLSSPTVTVITGMNDTYTGGDLMASLSGFDASIMTVEFDGIKHEDGVLYAKNAKTYKVTVTLTDNANYSFAGGESVVTVTWTVKPMVIARPSADTSSFTINGGKLYYNPIGFDGRYMVITGNVRDDAGTTVVTVELKDKENCVWDNNTTEALTFGWHIDTADTAFAVTVCILIALILVGAAVAVMQYISHRQRLTVFAEISENAENKEEGGNE